MTSLLELLIAAKNAAKHNVCVDKCISKGNLALGIDWFVSLALVCEFDANKAILLVPLCCTKTYNSSGLPLINVFIVKNSSPVDQGYRISISKHIAIIS